MNPSPNLERVENMARDELLDVESSNDYDSDIDHKKKP